MISKLNTYDIIGILIPGVIFLWAIQLPLKLQNMPELLPTSGGITEGSIFLFLSYGCGLMLQGFAFLLVEPIYRWKMGGMPSSTFLLPENKNLSEETKVSILKIATEHLGINTQKINDLNVKPKEKVKLIEDIFKSFNNAIEAKGLAERTLRFNAQYGMFRVLSLIFFILTLQFSFWYFGIFGSINDASISKSSLYLIILWLVLTVNCLLRMDKRARDFAYSVYQTSVLLKSEKGK